MLCAVSIALANCPRTMAKRPLSRKKRWQVPLMTAALTFYGGWVPVLADAVQEYTAKSVLALNLARYSEWPPDVFKDNGSSINLCVLGDDVVQQAFALIDKKQIGDKTLSVRDIKDDKHLDHCQLLYASEDAAGSIRLLEESQKQHILTIGETEDFLAHGGMVYLELTDARINLHVNISATQKAGLQISARVLKLATIFNP